MKGIQFKRSPFVRACLVKCIGHLTAVGIGFIPFLVAPSVALADVSVTLKLDRTEATVVDPIRLVVSVSGSRKSEPPTIKGLGAFDVSRGGTSSRVEIINGKVSSSLDYTYALQPKKTGTFTIGPAAVKVKGKAISSNTVTLTIVEPKQAKGVNRGPLFLSAQLSSKDVYVEEQTIYTLKLHTQTHVEDLSLSLPEAENLTFRQLGKPSQYESVYNGQPYQVLEVRYALIASKEGTHGIRPSRMSLMVFEPSRRSRRSLFDDPFFSFSSPRPVTIASEPLELNVRPLPEARRPATFSGLVGTYEIQTKLEPVQIKAGESATLTVQLKGRGNVKRMPDLELPELDQIKIYADQPVLTEEADVKGLAGTKTMKWALVPEKEGKYEIPPLSVSFFDTKSQRYKVIKSPLLSLAVLPAEKKEALIVANVPKEKDGESTAKQQVEELGRDILPVHTSLRELSSDSMVRSGGMLFWLMLLAPLLIYAATFSVLRFQRKSSESTAAMRAKKAAKLFVQQCRKGGLSSSDMTESIRQYLNERFDFSLGTLTSSDASDILRSRGVSVQTAEKLKTVLQRLEDAIYTGKGQQTCEMGDDIPALIKQIEKEIQ